MPLITLETEHPIAIDSPDHIAPAGTIVDNRTDQDYVKAVKEYFGKPIKVLDMGCAGGQMIADFIDEGYTAVGLEGSTHAHEGAGAANWSKYLNKNFFNVDLAEPFQLKEDGEDMKFDFIHSWDVIEHIHPDDLGTWFDNVKNHLTDDGVFCCVLATTPDYEQVNGEMIIRHRSMFNSAEWLNIFFDNGFEICVENEWHSYPVGRNYPDTVKPQCYHEAAGVLGTENGLYFGYLFGDAQFSNHDNKGANIYFCVRKKQVHEKRIPANWN